MTQYVRCIRNETLYEDDQAPTFDPLLLIDAIYKVVPPDVNDQPDDLRVIDGEGEDYLYPADYFEPFLPNGDQKSESLTLHLDPYTKGVLQAEAVAAKMSVGALLRSWIDERLDLPEAVTDSK
ncbi:MAG: hypothetical protein R3C14_10215 [Caldilineaceae bacterium]